MRDIQAPASDTSDKLEQKELAILHLIHSSVNNSRLDLARQAGLSPASITAIVQRLMMKGLVVESEPARSHLGRRPVPLEIRRDAAYLVGVDLGSFYLRIVITDINGNVLHKFQAQTEMQQGRERVLERAFHSIRQGDRRISSCLLIAERSKGIGIAPIPEFLLDSDAGLVLLPILARGRWQSGKIFRSDKFFRTSLKFPACSKTASVPRRRRKNALAWAGI